MYLGKAYSPATVLTQPINETATTIEVEDTSILPDAPNIAVIGVDENAETIIYSSKSDGILSGVQRGIEGIAKTWEIGEPIGRNWTNKDYDILIANILKLNEEIENNEIAHNATQTQLEEVEANLAVAQEKLNDTKTNLGVVQGQLENTETILGATQEELEKTKEVLNQHKSSEIPHVFTGEDSIKYNWGLRVDAAGNAIFRYEEM